MARPRVYRHDFRCPECGSNWMPRDGTSKGRQVHHSGNSDAVPSPMLPTSAVAVRLGCRNASQSGLFGVAARINRAIGYPAALSSFRAAGRLHSNMYRQFMAPQRLDAGEANVPRFVNRIAVAIGR